MGKDKKIQYRTPSSSKIVYVILVSVCNLSVLRAVLSFQLLVRSFLQKGLVISLPGKTLVAYKRVVPSCVQQTFASFWTKKSLETKGVFYSLETEAKNLLLQTNSLSHISSEHSLIPVQPKDNSKQPGSQPNQPFLHPSSAFVYPVIHFVLELQNNLVPH